MDNIENLLGVLFLFYVSGVAASFLGNLILIFPIRMLGIRTSGEHYYHCKIMAVRGEKYSFWKDSVQTIKECLLGQWWLSWLFFFFIQPVEVFSFLIVYFKIKRTVTDRLRHIIRALAFNDGDYSVNASVDAKVCAALIAYELECTFIRLDPKVIANYINCMKEDMHSGLNIDSKHIIGYLRNFFPELPEAFYVECERYLAE